MVLLKRCLDEIKIRTRDEFITNIPLLIQYNKIKFHEFVHLYNKCQTWYCMYFINIPFLYKRVYL